MALREDRKIQRLERLAALCPPCHEVKHAGLASKRGRLSAVIAHLAKLNHWSPDDAGLHLEGRLVGVYRAAQTPDTPAQPVQRQRDGRTTGGEVDPSLAAWLRAG